MLKRFKNYILEMALPLSLAKRMVKGWEPKEKYFEIFSHYDTGPRKNKKPYRIYFPLKVDRMNNMSKYSFTVLNHINYILKEAHEKGYFQDLFVVEDYVLGLLRKADDENAKRLFRVGKVLNNLKRKLEKEAPESPLIENIEKTLHHFNHDDARKMLKENDFMVVISHHAYDVAGMSTGRSWTNCMDLTNGINRHYVKPEVDVGVMVAYLIDPNDFNIENPKASLDIVPYFNKRDESKFVLHPRKIPYGNSTKEFVEFVHNWCEEVNEKFLDGKTAGLYCLPKGVYDDPHDTKQKVKIAPEVVSDFIKNVWKKKNHDALIGLSETFCEMAQDFIKLDITEFDKLYEKYKKTNLIDLELILNYFVIIKNFGTTKKLYNLLKKYKNIFNFELMKNKIKINSLFEDILSIAETKKEFFNLLEIFFNGVESIEKTEENEKLIKKSYKKRFINLVDVLKYNPNLVDDEEIIKYILHEYASSKVVLDELKKHNRDEKIILKILLSLKEKNVINYYDHSIIVFLNNLTQYYKNNKKVKENIYKLTLDDKALKNIFEKNEIKEYIEYHVKKINSFKIYDHTNHLTWEIYSDVLNENFDLFLKYTFNNPNYLFWLDEGLTRKINVKNIKKLAKYIEKHNLKLNPPKISRDTDYFKWLQAILDFYKYKKITKDEVLTFIKFVSNKMDKNDVYICVNSVFNAFKLFSTDKTSIFRFLDLPKIRDKKEKEKIISTMTQKEREIARLLKIRI